MLTRATDTAPRASKLIHMNGCIFTAATKDTLAVSVLPVPCHFLHWMCVAIRTESDRPARKDRR